MGPNYTEFGEITQNNDHYAVNSKSFKVTTFG